MTCSEVVAVRSQWSSVEEGEVGARKPVKLPLLTGPSTLGHLPMVEELGVGLIISEPPEEGEGIRAQEGQICQSSQAVAALIIRPSLWRALSSRAMHLGPEENMGVLAASVQDRIDFARNKGADKEWGGEGCQKGAGVPIRLWAPGPSAST